MSDLPAELASLATPQVIDEIDYEAELAALKADLVVRHPDAADVINLLTEPLTKLLEAYAYRVTLISQRINEAARANLVAYATGSDLDHLAAFYGVARLAGELDPALRIRAIEAVRGRATAGSPYWYRLHALSASTDVKDAAAYQQDETDPRVYVSVLSLSNGGLADQALLDTVAAVVASDPVRPLSDRVEVHAATITDVTVTADIWLYPDTSAEIFNGLSNALQTAFDNAMGLDWNLTRSWITAQCHVAGVQRVEITAPAADVVVDFKSAVRLVAVNLTLAGVDT